MESRENLDLAVQWLRRASINGSAEASLQLRRYENLLTRVPNQPVSYQATKKNGSIEIAASQSVISPIVDGNKSKTSYTAKEDPTEDDNFIFPANPTEESPQKTELAKQANLVDKNPQKAIEMLEEASSAGETEAVVELGKISYKKNDFSESIKWFKKLLKPGIPKLLDIWGFSIFLVRGLTQIMKKQENGLNQP